MPVRCWATYRWLCVSGVAAECVLWVVADPVQCLHAFGPLEVPLMPNILAAMSSLGPYPLTGVVWLLHSRRFSSSHTQGEAWVLHGQDWLPHVLQAHFHVLMSWCSQTLLSPLNHSSLWAVTLPSASLCSSLSCFSFPASTAQRALILNILQVSSQLASCHLPQSVVYISYKQRPSPT